MTRNGVSQCSRCAPIEKVSYMLVFNCFLGGVVVILLMKQKEQHLYVLILYNFKFLLFLGGCCFLLLSNKNQDAKFTGFGEIQNHNFLIHGFLARC